MRISRATDYGVRLVVYLAENPKRIIPRTEIAREMDIPGEFLAKIAQNLAKAGIIEIKQGRAGGYLLRRDPSELSLLEVVEALEGEICLNVCVGKPEACHLSKNCKVHLVWEAARDGLRKLLKGIPIANLKFSL
ncbi:transcriptional regulator, BadM/Rrf2 family [Thermodesulfatator indicus DSM 15286]|uniref:Transcriptional regulator, BadM/Rrf2 family n=1 Tax=Thermodesulfatator indicus (strain DSM 15286 / JCM 11887 / CIR29812) TaxID=667014 RepID=F8ACK3_THEID|nr:Rrf2 family transcriptional regulator [Thermodesulfatator indicus]AEH44708.1 transcriptional regulator, BadM/Rrf2 family [Thermodesulfatator indicus DSM 15286]